MAHRLAASALAVACCLAMGAAFAADPAPSGEKVQFSDPQDDFRIPEDDADGLLSPKAFEFLNRDSSVSGVILPNLAPSARITPNGSSSGRLLELYLRRMDEKKNWVYQRPDDANDQPTVEEMFGVRGAAGSTDKQSRSVVVEFFETPVRKPSASRSTDGSQDLFDRTGLTRSWDPGFGSGSRLEPVGAGRNENSLEWRGLGKPGFSIQNGFSVPDPVRPTDSLDPGFRPVRGREGEPLSRSDEFRKLLVIQNGINPLATGFDPINLRSDATRQELNPIIPVGLDNPLVGAGALAGAGPAAGTGRDGSLFDSGATLVGSSSLAPAVPTVAGPSRHLRQPVVLEMPRRKF